MKAGATDYLLKSRPWRLGPQVRRALIEKRSARRCDRAEEDLRALNAELEARVHLRTAELETANSFLDSVIQHIPHMVFVKNASDLRFVRVNRSFEQTTGRSEQEVLGKTAYEINPWKEEAAFLLASDKQALALGREVDLPQATLHTRDGEARILHAKKIPILDDSGQPRYVLTIAEDVTEKTKRQREVERLNAALAQRSTEVEAANRAKSTFLATMSHEIRTPDERRARHARTAEPRHRAERRAARVRSDSCAESSESLLRIIDDILDFSKIEAGKLELEPRSSRSAQLIEDGAEHATLGNASSKGLIVRRDASTRASAARCVVDPARLRQILINFVGNAIKFTAAGGSSRSVRDGWGGTGDGQACGSRSRTRASASRRRTSDRLFQPFSQADGRRGARFGGTGLGLVICRQLVGDDGRLDRRGERAGQGHAR